MLMSFAGSATLVCLCCSELIQTLDRHVLGSALKQVAPVSMRVFCIHTQVLMERTAAVAALRHHVY